MNSGTVKNISFNKRTGQLESGYACLWIIVQHYDKYFSEENFRGKIDVNRKGIALSDISIAAEKTGFRARCTKLTLKQLVDDAFLPCIIKWGRQYCVLHSKSGYGKGIMLQCLTPAGEIISYTRADFMRHWTGKEVTDKQATGEVLVLEPSFTFHNRGRKKGDTLSWRIILKFFTRSRLQVTQVVMSLLISSLIQLTIPFLMQSVVDIGINTQDLNYITIVLCAMFMLIMGRISVDFIRNRLILYITTTVNISIISEYWIKLTKLPISYFDRNHTGDILQRISDNKNVQNFLTGPTLTTIYSILNFIVFAIVLMMYKIELFIIFTIAMVLYSLWMQLFLRFRRKINYELFDAASQESNTTLQLVQGMQDIRLNNVGQFKRWDWEKMQLALFRLYNKRLNYNQLQQAGAMAINHLKDMVLTFAVAKLLVEGELTFGAMLAIQYIIGQLGAPIEQLIWYIQNAQDAKISMERLNEIHEKEEEEIPGKNYILRLPPQQNIQLSNFSFTFPGNNTSRVLNDLFITIPPGKTTAIVGESGCGKTTLLKILLKFYNQYEGNITVGDIEFKDISPTYWRSQCAAVFQDGFIFSDTIEKNISMEHHQADREKLMEACRIANILSFIESLPDGFNTRLGTDGTGISQGQKQRLLIARAVYKDPQYLFLDEFTNSLDATNEMTVVENLQSFSANRTIVVIAHRLSTVKNADNIIVMHQGRVVEQGTHEGLTRAKGRYFELIKIQLLAESIEMSDNVN
jgi:ATP-binding cassette subfamily B protein